MHAQEEIEFLRRRTSAMERDLAEVKARLEMLERGIAMPESPARPALVPTEPPITEPLTAAPFEMPRKVEQPIAATMAAPPVLPAAEEHQAPVPPPVSAPLEAQRAKPLREWLEPLQLWPPRGEENAEVRLGAWWATRVGALLAVIGVVFLGIYVSRGSAPWVRLVEVMAVTTGVLGLGGWLERKLPKFGAVVFGSGLALAYFCAFAAYGVAPMKVIQSNAVATACELAVVAAIFAVAWRRGSHVVATMAVALGHVTAFLALRGGPAGFGPWVVALLGLAAVLLRLTRGWGAPSALAMPLAWIFLAAASIKAIAAAGVMALSAAWFWATIYFTVFFVRDWLTAWRGGELERVDRTLQVVNASLAFTVGLLVTAQVGGNRLTTFYFAAGIVMLLAAIAWRRVAGGEKLVPIFACKTAGLVGLGVIAAFEGHARYLVLLAQAFAMLVSARQSHVRGLRVATAIAGAVALAFFMAELRPEYSEWRDRATVLEALFLGGAIGFVASMRRWLALDDAKSAFGAVVVAIAGISAAMSWNTAGWLPSVMVLVGLGLVGVAGAMRSGFVAAMSASLLLVAAHAAMWVYEPLRFGRGLLWINQAVLLGAAAAGLLALRRWAREDRRLQLAESILVALALATLVATGFMAFAPAAALAFAAVLGLVLAVAVRERERGWISLGAPLLGLGLVFFWLKSEPAVEGVWHFVAAIAAWSAPAWAKMRWGGKERLGAKWRNYTPAAHAVLATWVTLHAIDVGVGPAGRPLACAVAALTVFALAWRPRVDLALECSWALWCGTLLYTADRGAEVGSWLAFVAAWVPAIPLARVTGIIGSENAWRRNAAGIQVGLATLIGFVTAIDVRHGAARIAAFGAIAVLSWGVWRFAKVAAARLALAAIVAAGWIVAWTVAMSSHAQGWGAGLAAVVLAAAGVAMWPFVSGADLEAHVRRRQRWMSSVAALALAFCVFAAQRGAVADYATVGWGVTAVAMFLAGLFARSRPHRLAGLAGLALCVPRAFLVDLDSTLYRIVAFVALGVVLLWVGFSYHRFRHLIADEEKKL